MSDERKTVAVLGSTGSIGTQTLEVLNRLKDRFTVVTLSANSNAELLNAQAAQFGVDMTVLGSDQQRIVELAASADIIVNAISGFAGLRASIAALDAGKRLLLANKESCVVAGDLIVQRLRANRGEIVPIDSEHASLHMCLAGLNRSDVSSVVITASGGPFLRTKDLKDVTVEQALKHPTWSMGRKITIDSATLMNKGLEIIEAHVLFGLSYEQIEVVVHPQSIVHCIASLKDGSSLAGIAPPDMRIPIAYAFGAPQRLDWNPEPFDILTTPSLTFEPVDHERFPCAAIAIAAGKAGGLAPCVLNAANEIAVDAFLDGRISFTAIPRVIEATLESEPQGDATSVEGIEACDQQARHIATDLVRKLALHANVRQ